MTKIESNEISYMIIWSVSLDENRTVKDITQFSVIDMARLGNDKRPICIDFKPSDKFVDRAKEQIVQLDWIEFEPNTSDASAISFLYSSDPDSPVSTNDQRR